MLPMNLEPLHRFHSYCARFPSEIVETALKSYSKAGESVCDPFCGSGTTLVASLAHGRKTIGSDIDVLAGMISRVKCNPLSREEYDNWLKGFFDRLETDFQNIRRAWSAGLEPPLGLTWALGSLDLPIPSLPELRYWFPPQLTAGLAVIANAAHECKSAHLEQVALIALSASIITKWPKTLSYAMDIDHTRPHRKIQHFTLDRILSTYKGRLNRCVECLGELQCIYQSTEAKTGAARVICPHDARMALPEVAEESQSLIVTSPPYFNAVDYPRAHRLSVCWMNGHAPADLVSRRSYIGLRHVPKFDHDAWLKERGSVRQFIPAKLLKNEEVVRRLCAFYGDLGAVLANCWTVLKAGGHAVFVIANNVIQGKRIESDQILAELAKSAGFTQKKIDTREISSPRRRFPVGPFGFDGPMTHESVIVLRKPMPRRNSNAGGGDA